jgi:glucokinase
MITAIDIGATKTLVAQFDSTGKPINRIKFATSKNTDEFYEELVATLRNLHNSQFVCIAVPGIVDQLGVIKRCGRLPWLDFDLKGLLQKDFPSQTICIENDSKLGAIGEANAINPVPNMCLYVTISTGIGDGVVKNGKLVDALKYSEAGHMVLNDEGQWKTWQDIASGQTILKYFGKFARDITDSKDWAWIAGKIAIGMLALVPTIQPDVVIIGGSMGTYFDHFGPQLQEILNKRLPIYIKRPILVNAKHPEEAVIYGCYYYVTHQQNI